MLPSGEGAAQPYGMGCRLAARIGYLYEFQGRDGFAESFGQFSLKRGGTAAKQGIVGLDRPDNGLANTGGVVSEQVGRKCGMVIYIFIAIDIIDLTALSGGKYDRRVNLAIQGNLAAGNVLFGLSDDCLCAYVAVFIEVHWFVSYFYDFVVYNLFTNFHAIC